MQGAVRGDADLTLSSSGEDESMLDTLAALMLHSATHRAYHFSIITLDSIVDLTLINSIPLPYFFNYLQR